MQIFHSLQDIPAGLPPALVTIGNFDGVHRGHRAVIQHLVSRARERGLLSIAVTFDPHPVRLLRPEKPHSLITPLPLKLKLLAQTGLDAVLVLPFSAELAGYSPEQFVQEVLCHTLHTHEIHEGADFRFGAHGAGNMATLEHMGEDCGFSTHTFQPLVARADAVSSSRIRTLIRDGEISRARALLGRPFLLQSHPASGRGYGSRYTVPTINLAPYPELLPGTGVYITCMTVGLGGSAETFQAVTNVGSRPTFAREFADNPLTVESYLLNFHPIALTPETPLSLAFLKRLRPEQTFPSPEALRAQISQDVARAQRFFRLAAPLHREPTAVDQVAQR